MAENLGTYKFQYTSDTRKVSVSFENPHSLEPLLDYFMNFLGGCGFHFDISESLELVKDERT